MATKKKKVAKAGAGAYAAGQAVRDNAYVQRLVEDDEVRDNLRNAYESARKAYERMSKGKGPVKALDDKKTQKELREAAHSLRDAAESLRGAKKKKRRGRLLLVMIVGAGLALALSEGLRKQVLDALFGAEEEFEYTSTTTPTANGGSAAPPSAASSASTASGSAEKTAGEKS